MAIKTGTDNVLFCDSFYKQQENNAEKSLFLCIFPDLTAPAALQIYTVTGETVILTMSN